MLSLPTDPAIVFAVWTVEVIEADGNHEVVPWQLRFLVDGFREIRLDPALPYCR